MIYLVVGILAALFLAYFAWMKYKGNDNKEKVTTSAQEQVALGTSGGAIGDIISSPGNAGGISGGGVGNIFEEWF